MASAAAPPPSPPVAPGGRSCPAEPFTEAPQAGREVVAAGFRPVSCAGPALDSDSSATSSSSVPDRSAPISPMAPAHTGACLQCRCGAAAGTAWLFGWTAASVASITAASAPSGDGICVGSGSFPTEQEVAPEDAAAGGDPDWADASCVANATAPDGPVPWAGAKGVPRGGTAKTFGLCIVHSPTRFAPPADWAPHRVNSSIRTGVRPSGGRRERSTQTAGQPVAVGVHGRATVTGQDLPVPICRVGLGLPG